MRSRISLLVAAGLLLCSFYWADPGWPLARIRAAYTKANALYQLNNPTAEQDSTALAGFGQVIAEYKKLPGYDEHDTLLFQSYLKKGVLLEVHADFAAARDAYMEALRLHPQSDSMGFVAQVFAGANYYNLYNFDSASSLLLKAEMLAPRFKDDDDAVRLYNTLGALYLDDGNYHQGKNYFNKALDVLKSKKVLDTLSAVSIETNIATACNRMQQYDEALTIYRSILSYRMGTDAIYLNMGVAYAWLQQHEHALFYFRKVNPDKIPNVLNEMAKSELKLKRYDSAAFFLDRLRDKFSHQATGLNDLDLGISELYRSDLLAEQRQYKPALSALQKAILIFTPSFGKTDIYSNPSDFTGTVVSFRLYNALNKKAAIFQKLYDAGEKDDCLMAAFEAYKAALNLLRYIEKTFDTDEAKVFLKNNTSTIYPRALAACLELYRKHPDRDYLQQAFQISEQGKASIMAANLKETRSDHLSPRETALLDSLRNIKYNIARLDVRSEAAADNTQRQKIAAERLGYEIELSRAQKEMEQNGSYYRRKYDDAAPDITALQGQLGSRQALISLSVGGEKLHVFVLTRHSLTYTAIDSLGELQKDVAAWLDGLKGEGDGRRFKGEKIGGALYRLLIQPIQKLAGDKEEWTIIPDGFLCFLPFESLPAGGSDNGRYLLETNIISYQPSARFMTADNGPHISGQVGVLGFAPYSSSMDGKQDSFAVLPASREEIAGLPGKQYFDVKATKGEFLHDVNQYPILHLATHAVSFPDKTAASFIAFYPGTGSPIEDRLYLEEIYGLNMDSTKLVIMSACETGQGQLVNNEGVISLARAFTYAGCRSTISSLWKTEDKATAFILARFYVYLKKGYDKARSLQQAKLDYLKSGTINKSAAYWSSLVLTGSTEPLYRQPFPWGAILGALATLVLIIYAVRSRDRWKVSSSPGRGKRDVDRL